MISPAEIMSLMTAHGIVVGHIPGGSAKLTQMDIAGAMGIAHVPTPYQMLALARLCLDQSARHQAWAYWFKDRMDLYRGEDWPKGRIETLCVYTLAEHLSPNCCPRCGGVGGVVLGELKRECDRCRGTGRYYPGDRAMARLFDVSRGTWEKAIAPIVADGRRELHRWEHVALLGVRDGLGWGS